MTGTLELAGFVIGIIGAIWLKVSMNFLKQERDQPETKKLLPGEESPAVVAFIKGLSLILTGLGMETFARLFLS
jgi:hypothetical protein